MRSAIAVIMAILGVILVLGGVAAFWAGAVTSSRTADGTAGGDATASTAGSFGRLDRSLTVAGRLPAERLITWGVVLLGLSAVAAGAITFSATAAAGTS